jgi:hypothetical protein
MNLADEQYSRNGDILGIIPVFVQRVNGLMMDLRSAMESVNIEQSTSNTQHPDHRLLGRGGRRTDFGISRDDGGHTIINNCVDATFLIPYS